MKELLLTAPTGEVFVLNPRGEYYIHTYNQGLMSIHQAGARIRHWVEAEGWMEAFDPYFYPITIDDVLEGKI